MFVVFHLMRNKFTSVVYLIAGNMKEQIYSRCLPVAMVLSNLCTHVHLLNVVERMCLDVVQFQDMESRTRKQLVDY